MKILIASLFLSASVSSYAKCHQQKKEILIGCTYKCNSFYDFALKKNARINGYNVRTINLSEADANLSDMDAILIPGGADIDPELYLSQIPDELAGYTRDHLNFVKYSEEGKFRDPIEFKIVTEYLINSTFSQTPMLGICRGMQMMAVASKLPLYVDIKHELGINNRYNKIDKVIVNDPNSLMADFYPSKKTYGVKFHHQGIRVDYFKKNADHFPNLKIASYSQKGLIAESLELKDRPALGVQYHPEKALTPGNGKPIWKWFLGKACEKSNSRL
jgi:gamma-glutamyl-gamma-aminobutyrate hydrolase PuuD